MHRWAPLAHAMGGVLACVARRPRRRRSEQQHACGREEICRQFSPLQGVGLPKPSVMGAAGRIELERLALCFSNPRRAYAILSLGWAGRDFCNAGSKTS